MIYDPLLKKLFVKEIMVDLSHGNFYPEFPEIPRKMGEVVAPKKKTMANMWRKWREDSDTDVELALLGDMAEVSF